jgi:8-oxo-dGTP pyrophosphatase MutT (NUDIX family)
VNEPKIGRWCAAALMVTEDGRYLMQLRDANPEIILPNHWGCFGGTVDPGEDGAAAIRRELQEELEFRVHEVTFFTEMTILLPFAQPRGPRTDRMSFFLVPIDASSVRRMVQHEGADRRLFRPEALAAETRVAPWDLSAVLMHARRRPLFRGG